MILLTKRRNYRNWFGVFDRTNNAFIDCANWEFFTDAEQRFPIVFEVVSNLFRMLLKPKMELPNPFFHELAIGCLNDLCVNKADISLKLRTADICAVCIDGIRKQQVDERILEQIVGILEGVRLQFLFRQGLGRPTKLSKIILTENNKLYLADIGNHELKLTPLYKTLYVFYLNHLQGVKLNELSDHREELMWWYGKFSISSSRKAMEASISALVDSVGSSFSEKKSHLNREIEKSLGVELSKYYKIEGARGEAFKINLSAELVMLPLDRSRRYA